MITLTKKSILNRCEFKGMGRVSWLPVQNLFQSIPTPVFIPRSIFFLGRGEEMKKKERMGENNTYNPTTLSTIYYLIILNIQFIESTLIESDTMNTI